MVERITRALLVIQLTAALLIGGAAWRTGGIADPVLAGLFGIAVVVLVRMVITANNFFLARRYRSALPAQFELAVPARLRMFLDEFRSTMLSSSWTMAFHTFDKRIAARSQSMPVLLVHGYGCNSGYWHSMSRALSHADITHYAINLEPVFADIDDYAEGIQEGVERTCRETGHEKIVIVAHSMGGLAARAYLRRYGAGRIARVITLGTPHNGTGLAGFGIGPNSRQMRWELADGEGRASEWLRELHGSEDASLRSMFVSIYSHHDNIISPQLSSHLEGALNIEFHAIGHVALALNRAVQECVVKQILAIPVSYHAEHRAARTR